MVGADEMYANTQHTLHNDVLHVSCLKLLDITRNLFSWWKICCVLACPSSPLDLPCGSYLLVRTKFVALCPVMH